MNYRTIITLGLLLFTFNLLSAQNETETRSYSKTMSVGPESTLEVSNKYGAIHILPWSKDSVYIKAEVKAFAPNDSRLRKMIDGVTINFTETSYLIRAQTEFTQNINMLFESFKGITSKLISYDSHVEIDYYISVPEYLNMRIENKYGDVYMENNSGNSSITVNNGSFKANSLGKGSSVNLVFCDATINTLASGKVDASFSEITIGETNDLSINSISSRYEIKHAGILRTESRRDKFFIDNVASLHGNSYFSDYKVYNLKEDLDIISKYGSVNVDNLENHFGSVNINSSYSDISLGFEQGSSYNFDIRYINAFLVLPDRNISTEEKTINEDKKEYLKFGTVGKNPGNTKVKIDATRGNIYIK